MNFTLELFTRYKAHTLAACHSLTLNGGYCIVCLSIIPPPVLVLTISLTSSLMGGYKWPREVYKSNANMA